MIVFPENNCCAIFYAERMKCMRKYIKKDKEGQYHWVAIHVIRVQSESGDVMHICFNRKLEGIHEERYGQK